MVLDLEERSFENLVNFYREELIKLSEGCAITELFTKNARRKLMRYGVTEKRIGGYVLSEKTRIILGLET